MKNIIIIILLAITIVFFSSCNDWRTTLGEGTVTSVYKEQDTYNVATVKLDDWPDEFEVICSDTIQPGYKVKITFYKDE